ncbi:hypothetical protein DYQ86_16425 [Acidobacteria bacterium AB60]|nr:hypothetical protein DYQ86_16425 [Acidobacteria bacterium AB60]
MTRRPQQERQAASEILRAAGALLALVLGSAAGAQEPPAATAGPIAIVPADTTATVTGTLQVSAGKTLITANGSVTSADKTTEVTLPRRGMLRICAATSVKFASDHSVPAGEIPGLMMALDHGAIEADFATAQNSDILITPDFRILISGPGAAQVKVRLGAHGDTCVDNPGPNAPYVLVSSVFDGGAYRVQAGQRVMFQHGSLQEVVDQEKEPCGCPPESKPGSNEFPVAQSAGFAPLQPPMPSPAPAPTAPAPPPQSSPAAAPPVAAAGNSPQASQVPTEPLMYPPASAAPAAQAQPEPPPAPEATTPIAQPSPVPTPPPGQKPNQPGFFRRIGRFFKRIFGAE